LRFMPGLFSRPSLYLPCFAILGQALFTPMKNYKIYVPTRISNFLPPGSLCTPKLSEGLDETLLETLKFCSSAFIGFSLPQKL